MKEIVVEVQNLHKSFGTNQVLSGVDFEVCRGETLVVLGGSGSGKSVLLKCITGLMAADSGSIRLLGEEMIGKGERELLPLRKKMGILFQGGALFDSMNVFDNIAFGFREHEKDMPEEQVAAEVMRLLKVVKLPDVCDRMPAELSGGMQKRVALARAVALKPGVIFYDEPTTGLDPETARSIYHLIRDMKQHLSVTSVVVSHDIELAFTIADRIAFLKDGKMAFVGPVEELRKCTHEGVCGFIGTFYRDGMTGRKNENN
ncbi:MAG: ATP-binding cassette domain-containing protein [Acidobacteria bacterium]|nr:ATP-binding cassette domain-containing protein [Acidobacteriota bacterium]